MSKSFDFLKSCGVFFVSTINGDAPAVRPFGAVMEREGHLYISTSNTKDVYRQMKQNPCIQITALKNGTREWIRIQGKAVESTSLEAKRTMLRECPMLSKRFDSENSPHFALFEITGMIAYLCTEQGMEQLVQ